MTNPMDFKPINQNIAADFAQGLHKKEQKNTPDMLAFSDQLNKFINQPVADIISKPLTETNKLDEYISLQAQKIYQQNIDFKPQAIKIQPFEEVKTSSQTQEIDKTAPEKLNRFHNLEIGATGEDIKEIQKLLIKWNPKMRRFIAVNGLYNERTAKAISLFQSIYGLEPNGKKIDLQTSKLLLGVKDGSFWKFDGEKPDQYHPEKTVAGKILYAALSDLGTPYHLGGDGEYTTDCAMFTRRALIGSDATTNAFSSDPSTRMADIQYMHAEQGKNNMALVKDPQPGDLIFFKNTSYQAGIAYKRITHVAIYVDKNTMLAASPYHGGVTIQNINEINPNKIVGYGRLSPKSESVATKLALPSDQGI